MDPITEAAAPKVTSLLRREALETALRELDFDKRLVVTPLLDDDQVTEGSIDLRLGTEFLMLRRTLQAGIDIDDERLQMKVEKLYERSVVPFGGGLWLHPRQLVLGATLEFIRLPPTMGAYVLTRSSWGRVGLLVATAIYVQPGFGGCLTLELVNDGESPIELCPGTKVAQLTVHMLDAKTELKKRDRNYVAPTGPQPARLTKDQLVRADMKLLGERLRRMPS